MPHSQHSEFLVGQQSQGTGTLPNRSSDSASEDHFVRSTAEKPPVQTSSTKRTFCIKNLCSLLLPQMQEIRSGQQSLCVCGQGEIATAIKEYVVNDVYLRIYIWMNNVIWIHVGMRVIIAS